MLIHFESFNDVCVAVKRSIGHISVESGNKNKEG